MARDLSFWKEKNSSGVKASDTYHALINGEKATSLKVLAIDNLTLIAQWILKQNDKDYDGIYEIKFNDNLECVYFKSWEMMK